MSNGVTEFRPHRSEKQKQAIRDAYKLLCDQFDDVLIVCALREDQEREATDLDVYWKGSWLVVNGLADFAKDRILYRKRNKSEPEKIES